LELTYSVASLMPSSNAAPVAAAGPVRGPTTPILIVSWAQALPQSSNRATATAVILRLHFMSSLLFFYCFFTVRVMAPPGSGGGQVIQKG
jgi:hypothetical protein